MGLAGAVAFYAFLALYLLCWFVLVVVNAWRLVKVVGLPDDEKSDNRGWVVWACSVASLFTGCCFAVVTWAVMEWILQPLDPFEDSLGTIQLFGIAKTNITFVIVTNVLLALAFGLFWSTAPGLAS